jgi:hypothetical protein
LTPLTTVLNNIFLIALLSVKGIVFLQHGDNENMKKAHPFPLHNWQSMSDTQKSNTNARQPETNAPV